MKPTIGRIVHYHSPADGVLAAIVVGVYQSEGMADLCVHYRNGTAFFQAVPLGTEGPLDRCWTWPPRV